jgi:hypothetical protein
VDTVTITTVARLLAGLAALFLGRRLYWLFVAIVGFGVGMTMAPQFLPGQPQWVILVVAVVAGFLGAILAILLKKVAVGVAGFIAGGYLSLYLLSFFSVDLGSFQGLNWAIFIIGGIVGALLVGTIFDIALIILSSGVGAGLIANTLMHDFSLQLVVAAVVFIVLFVVGIIIQKNIVK